MITQVDGEWVVHDSFAAVFYGPGARLLPRPFTRSTVAPAPDLMGRCIPANMRAMFVLPPEKLFL